MMRSDELMLGDYVLVSGIPRKVEAITKKKIGYHINPQADNRLYYARLHDVEPIEIDSVVVQNWDTVSLQSKDCGFLLSGFVTYPGDDFHVLNFDFPVGNTTMYCPFNLHEAHHLAKAFNPTSVKLKRLKFVTNE